MPLATVAAGKPLPLKTAVNPAWAEAIENLRREVAAPLFGDIDSLSNERWLELNGKFALYDAWQAAKEGAVVESLGIERIRELLSHDIRKAIDILFAKDQDLRDEMEAIGSVDRLIRYHRNLAPLLDANGWAVNTKAMINLPFGTSLTDVAALPPGAQRSLRDPYLQRRTPWRLYAILTLVLIVFGYLWEEGYLAKWRDQITTRVEQAVQQVQKPAGEEPKP